MPAVGNTTLGSGGLGTGVSYQDSLRRCSQRKKSDVLLLGCASLLASVALGQDLLQLGKLQVGKYDANGTGNRKTLNKNMCDLMSLSGASGRAGPQRRAAQEKRGPLSADGAFPSQHVSAQPKPLTLALQTSRLNTPLHGPVSLRYTPLLVLALRLQLHKVPAPLRPRRVPPDPNHRG